MRAVAPVIESVAQDHSTLCVYAESLPALHHQNGGMRASDIQFATIPLLSCSFAGHEFNVSADERWQAELVVVL